MTGSAHPAPWWPARIERIAFVALAVILGGWVVATGLMVLLAASTGAVDGGRDFWMYLDRTRSWFAGTGFYLPHQLGGPYVIQMGDATYPPVALLLLIPFTVLPALAWWLVPAAIAAGALRRIRPAGWSRIALLAALAWPRTWDLVLAGNPAIWCFAFLLAGEAWGWPTPFAALKLTLAPFAAFGIWRRRWWAGAALGLALCVPFGPMWPDYLTAMRNAQSAGQVAYIVADWPVALLLLAATSSSRRESGWLGAILSSWR